MIRRVLIRILTIASAVFSTGYYILAEREMAIASHVIINLKQPPSVHMTPSVNTIKEQSEDRQLNPTPNKSMNMSSTSPPRTTTAPPYPFRYIINNRRKCNTDEHLKLVILVISAPKNFAARLAIRKTWGIAAIRKDVSMIFLLGGTSDTAVQKKLVEEDKLYGDIVQEDFVDTYRNLTLKTVALLRWVNLFCMNAQFVLKVDDDNFVNVPNLLDFLIKNKDAKKVIYGKVWHKVKPIRDKRSKWSVSQEEFKGDSYPDYTGGSSYVISIDSVKGLLDAARKLKSFPVEDVFITGLCAEYANVSRVHDARFQVNTDVAAPCSFRNLIVANGVSHSALFIAWWYTNDPLFDICEIAKAKQTCAQQSRHVLLDLAGLVANKIVKS